MRLPNGKARTTIRLTVVTVFVFATILTAGIATGLQYYFGQIMAKEAASNLYATVSSSVAAELRSTAKINANVIDLLADNPSLQDFEQPELHLATFIRVLEKNPLYYGIYIGNRQGRFFEVVNLATSKKSRQFLQAQPDDRWLIIEIRSFEGINSRHYSYLGASLEPRWSRSEVTDYEVSKRPWYKSAMSAQSVQFTAPYLFAQSGTPGRTLSRRIPDSDTVIALDMTMATISDFLGAQRIAGHGDVFLFTEDGQIVGSSAETAETTRNNKSHTETISAQSLVKISNDASRHSKMIETTIDGSAYLAFAAPVGAGQNALFMGILTPWDKVVAPFREKVLLSISITAALLLLLLPFSWFFANPIVRPIKQLALENKKVQRREYNKVQRIGSHVKELDELSQSMVSMVEAIQAHEVAQRRLMDSFIELIAQAIDDKSAYTGSHCKRVPELALMLAEQASLSEQAPFKDFSLNTDDEWREYRIAAWLHDCGKITTPEHIVDKGSKLETIYNRIHEVRMRFEVLWRDAELNYWQSLSEQPSLNQELALKLSQQQRKLQQDYAFIAECNVGGEFLDEDKLRRLHELASISWMRNFDDKLGLSPAEELRVPAGKQPLPVTEFLLSDKLEHVLPRTNCAQYPPKLGIDMDIPRNLYNLGEIYNLSISRGTLTEEDRFKINEHMISTIKMLDSLPFPDELKNVPRYASTHHETMEGTGYPRKLTGDKLSIPERLLVIADIFEALTASDRPYKKAKSVSSALDIMHKMAVENHIDNDCFQLFVQEEIYLRYAKEFLPESQLDPVDLEKYLIALS